MNDPPDSLLQNIPSASPENSGRYAAELMEIGAIQQKKASWGRMLFMLVVSMALFVGTGSASWSLEYAAMLIPLMLFHETGHYIGMKLSGYRNLQMFFIPFFGAAVSGHSYDVPGWKKAVVYLAGPVPGILLGAVAGAAGLQFQLPWLISLGTLALFLNGMNLLPLLPLDGARVMQELLFFRHFMFDVAFRVITVAAVGYLAYVLKDPFFGFLAFVTFIGISGAFRSGSLVRRLRLAGTEWMSSSSELEGATAIRILEEVDSTYPPKGLNPRLRAQIALGIFESLKSRPPGFVATILLGLAYLFSLTAAIVCLFVITVAQQQANSDPRLLEEPDGVQTAPQ